jgi:hypothetical protein
MPLLHSVSRYEVGEIILLKIDKRSPIPSLEMDIIKIFIKNLLSDSLYFN